MPWQVLACEWHEVLFALYGLDEVERVDGLFARLERNDHAFDLNRAFVGSRELEQQREAILREMRGPPVRASGMPLAQLQQFPGMPGYRKHPVS